VHLVRGQWNSAFLDEAEFFPSGKHKDQIDTAAYAYNILAMVKKRPKAANAS
jgi:phage terminase large subunit-like protein